MWVDGGPLATQTVRETCAVASKVRTISLRVALRSPGHLGTVHEPRTRMSKSSTLGFGSGAVIGALVASALLGGAWFATMSNQPAAHPVAAAQLPSSHPPVMGTPAPSPAPGVEGEVLEALQVPSYTYLRLKTGTGEVWAAVPTTQVQPGATVAIANATPMNGFTSKTLNRTFDQILFGSLAGNP